MTETPKPPPPDKKQLLPIDGCDHPPHPKRTIEITIGGKKVKVPVIDAFRVDL